MGVRSGRAKGGVVSVRTNAANGYGQQPALQLVQVDKAWLSSRGRRIIIADINSRVDYSHPALSGHLTGGYDFVLNSSSNGESQSVHGKSSGSVDRVISRPIHC